MAKKLIFDPPAGWRYGFPKVCDQREGESPEECLLRNGYPQHEIDNGGAKYVRFWDEPE